MNEQEAIETILYASAFNREDSPLTQALDMAIEALKKQIPKKPVICDGFMTVARCPVCNDVLSFLSKHCKDCGNKIDWKVEE